MNGVVQLAGVAVGVLSTLSAVVGVGQLVPRLQAKAQVIWRHTKAWWVIAPLVGAILCLGARATVIGVLVLSVYAVKEFARATGLYRDWWFIGVVYLGLVGFAVTAWLQWYGLFMVMPIYIAAALVLLPIVRNQFEGMVQKVALSLMAVVLIGWFPAHLCFIRQWPEGMTYLLYLLMATEFNDIAAFLGGKLWGRRPLVSRISPNKTVEGALTALGVTVGFAFVVAPWLPHWSWPLALLSALIVWIGGTLGDLVISFVKRDLGIKDMGQLIPAHGGLLDRVDSLLLVAPLFFHLVRFFSEAL